MKAVFEAQHDVHDLVAEDKFKSYDELKTKLNEVLGDTEVSAAVSTTTKEVPTAETSSTESNDFQEVFESKTEEVKKEDDEDLEDYFKSLAQD